MPKKLAVLVGCGYYETPFERYGCEYDVRTIEEVLATLEFLPENITTLIQPTRVNIQNALNNMRIKAGIGDVLCFYFSGLVKNQSDNIPAIYSSDGQFIPATEFQSLATQLPERTSFTLLLESSNSSGFIDPVATHDKRILFSACRANETAKRVVPDVDNANAYGMFTDAIRQAFHVHPRPVTNEQLLGNVNAIGGLRQQVGLFCNANNRRAEFLEYPRAV